MNALELGSISLRLTKEMDRDGWLALFTPDAVVEDPVGSPPGGRQGIEAIAAFHDGTISMMKSFDYEIERTYLCGDECAMVVTFHIDLGTSRMDMDVVNIYTASSDGKLASLRSFWDGSKQG
jgi:steroid Delta-isomerase